jgi:hypothetical protein
MSITWVRTSWPQAFVAVIVTVRLVGAVTAGAVTVTLPVAGCPLTSANTVAPRTTRARILTLPGDAVQPILTVAPGATQTRPVRPSTVTELT